MARLQPGDNAPPFSLPDQQGNMVGLTDYTGKKLLIFFYPKANTSG
jgi:peroxiredoxin Q/BCP